MLPYEEQAYKELELWKKKILKKPGFFDLASKGIQNRLNKLIPEKVHNAITVAIEKMVKAVLFGAKYVTKEPRKIVHCSLGRHLSRREYNFTGKQLLPKVRLPEQVAFCLALQNFQF
jgi:hypothetical protein